MPTRVYVIGSQRKISSRHSPALASQRLCHVSHTLVCDSNKDCVCEGISTDHRRRFSTGLLFLHSCHLSSLPGCWRMLWHPSFQTSWQWFHSWVSPWEQQSSLCFQSAAARVRKHLMLFITSFYCFGPKATNCRKKKKKSQTSWTLHIFVQVQFWYLTSIFSHSNTYTHII